MANHGSLFVSDLHLDPAWPAITDRFLRVLDDQARAADALYILGDLFEAWVGDDDLDDHSLSVIKGLRAVSDAGVPVTLLHGNRDFLIGEAFAERAGATVESTPLPLNLEGERSLLMHGDELCLEDEDYLRFRAMVRSPQWQSEFLAKPLVERKQIVRGLREQSEADKRLKPADLMDVTADEVRRVMECRGVTRLIHGHTHRPADHRVDTAMGSLNRHVLADWTEQTGELFWVNGDGIRREPVT